MTKEHIRHRVWEDLLDASRTAHYFHSMSESYRRRVNASRGLLIVSAVFAMIAGAQWLPPETLAVAGIAITGLLLWEMGQNYAGKAALLQLIAQRCNRIETGYRDLWEQVNSEQEEEEKIMSNREMLAREVERMQDTLSTTGIKVDEQLNLRCTEKAYQIVEQRDGHVCG